MARAQASARLDPELVVFFTGHWTGKGEFATGAPIEADVDFKLTLDSAWLLCEHRDRPPHRYKATSMWGEDLRGTADSTGVGRGRNGRGQFVGFTFDNFHGHRQWKSDGWVGGKLVLSGEFEHFIYERVSDTQFKMTYETSRDGVSWKLGDWLVFTRS
jgi:hypothetical protein